MEMGQETNALARTRESILFPKGHSDDPPQVLALYRRCEKWGSWWDGGQADQPHILMAEFDMCQAAILHVERVEVPYLLSLYSTK
jgi:hypothetical protein